MVVLRIKSYDFSDLVFKPFKVGDRYSENSVVIQNEEVATNPVYGQRQDILGEHCRGKYFSTV